MAGARWPSAVTSTSLACAAQAVSLITPKILAALSLQAGRKAGVVGKDRLSKRCCWCSRNVPAPPLHHYPRRTASASEHRHPT
jgi:hypothetical protein